MTTAADRRLSDRVEVGYVARPHGVRGELRVVLHNPESRSLAGTDELWLADRRFGLAGARATQGAWLVRLAGIADRDAAEALKGAAVAVPRASLALEPGEYLLADLVGCRCELPDGRPWGEIVALELGPQDRLVVHDGDVERLLPAVDVFLVEVDVEAGRVVVDPPEGLPEEPIP